jgi:predicted dienelactone hydrolase
MKSGTSYLFLLGLWGSSASDVFVVGGGGTILHYDGSGWSPMSSGVHSTLISVWGESSSDVFIVGRTGKILHYDGKTWSLMNSGTTENLWGVWGSSGRDVFAIGKNGTILHYDGQAWSPMESGTTTNLKRGIWGSSGGDVFAFGDKGVILHYDGTAWSPMTSGTTIHLESAWGSSASNVFAVGGQGTILHYDGQAWSDMSSMNVALTPTYTARGSYAVGMRDFVVEDGDHVVTLAVWYPALNANQASEEITYHISDKHPYLPNFTVKGHAILNADPDTAHGPYPLVIFSSGQFGWRQYSAYFVEHLASYGFVVMASDPRGETMFTFWAGAANRPLDTKLTISFADKATAPGGALDGLIDTNHIAIAGHSSGGWTALVGGGAQFDLDKCAKYPNENCLEFVPHVQEIAALLGLKTVPTGLWPPLNDPRVGAIIALAPDGDIWGADYEGVAVVKVPALIMNGTKDTIVRPERAAYPIYQHLGSTQKGLIKLINADHEIFSDSCDTGIPWCAQESDVHEHNLINHFATAFLLTELKGDQEAAKALLPENVSFPSIEYETTGFSATEPISSSTSATIPAGAILLGNLQRTGVYDTLGPQQGKLKWKFAVKAAGEAIPVATVANGLVYSGSTDGYLYAVDVQTGQEKWNFKTGGLSGLSAPTIVTGVVYVGSSDYHLYALDGQTGQEKWRFKTGGIVGSSPAVANGVVYFGSADHYLYALDSQTGQQKWQFKTKGSVLTPAIAGDLLYVGSNDGSLYAVDRQTGQQKWRFEATPFQDMGYSPAIADGVAYIASLDGYLYAIQ